MTREEVSDYIRETYSVEADYPWLDDNAVYRHVNNKKWFALIMQIPRNRIGLNGDEPLDIMNVKSTPALIGSFRKEPGIYPAYHMNKSSWLSVALDGSVSNEVIMTLLELSYDLTASRKKVRTK